MRAFFYKLFLLFQIIFLFTSVSAVSAQNLPQQSEQRTVYTFRELGYEERVMLGPYATVKLQTSLPPTWELNTGAKIVLRYKFTSSNLSNGSLFQDGHIGGFLTITFNEVVIDTIILDQNTPAIKEITIPFNALKSKAGDGRHELAFFLDASFDCEQASRSNLVLEADSEIDFQHTKISPIIDLSEFPRSIYQPEPLIPINTVMVVPDQPSEMELQAALSAMAGIGSATNGEMTIPLLTDGKLTQEILSSSNLIFVGGSTKLPLLGNVEFPLPYSNNKILVNGALDDDGIIQMAASPWNPERVVYFISGNTDAGILKAGQTLGTGYLVPSGKPSISVIRSVNPNSAKGLSGENQTFADLGYSNTVMGPSHGQFLTYTFFASAEQAASTDGYLDLIITQSDLIDFSKSGLSVQLNGNLIGTISFEKQTDSQLVTTRLKFFAGILQRGVNYIDIISELVPLDICASQNLIRNSSITIAESSLIHLPITSPVSGLSNDLFLNVFPNMFLTQKDLSDLAFILPSNDPTSWDYASRIAYHVGFRGSVFLPSLQASFGEKIPEEIQKSSNMIIVGRAQSLPVVTELAGAMPAPFESGSDEAVQPSMLVNYRLLPGVNVGYLELFPSPWNSDKSILAVMANSEEGLPSSVNMLLTEESIAKLGGNFSIIYGSRILNTDTRLGVSGNGLVSELPVAVTVSPNTVVDQNNLPASPTSQVPGRPAWIVPVLLILVLAIIVVAIFAIRGGFSNSNPKNNPDQGKREM